MRYYFLKEDYEALEQRISELVEKLREVGQDIGEACRQSAETYHDNFAYEEAERLSHLLSQRLRELLEIRDNAVVVNPPRKGDRVALGRKVTILDLESGKEQTFKVGSYLVLRENGSRSYRAPLVRLLIGAEVGDVCEGVVGGRHRAFEVVAIE